MQKDNETGPLAVLLTKEDLPEGMEKSVLWLMFEKGTTPSQAHRRFCHKYGEPPHYVWYDKNRWLFAGPVPRQRYRPVPEESDA